MVKIHEIRAFINRFKNYTGKREIDSRIPRIIEGVFRKAWYNIDFDDLRDESETLLDLIIITCIQQRINDHVDKNTGFQFAKKLRSDLMDYFKDIPQQHVKKVLEATVSYIRAGYLLR